LGIKITNINGDKKILFIKKGKKYAPPSGGGGVNHRAMKSEMRLWCA
jgi:hypothetical protein